MVALHVAADHVEVVEVEDLVAGAEVVAGVEEVAEAVVPGGAGVEDKKIINFKNSMNNIFLIF